MKSEQALTCGTLAFVAIWVIDTLGPIQTRSTGTVVDVNLAYWPRETSGRKKGDPSQSLPCVLLAEEMMPMEGGLGYCWSPCWWDHT